MDILQNLINDDRNIELKTQIDNPRNYAIFLVYLIYVESFQNETNGEMILQETSEILHVFDDKYKKLMFSNKRKSREEIKEILCSIFANMRPSDNQEKSSMEKLMIQEH